MIFLLLVRLLGSAPAERTWTGQARFFEWLPDSTGDFDILFNEYAAFLLSFLRINYESFLPPVKESNG